MAEISASPDNAERFRVIDSERVSWLEDKIQQLDEHIDMPREFIVPGDSLAAAYLDVARAVVRRAERNLAQLVHEGMEENFELLRYLNRLSSLCFVLELMENRAGGKHSPTLAKFV